MFLKIRRFFISVYYWTILGTIRDIGICPITIQKMLDAHVSKSWIKIQHYRNIVDALTNKLERNRINKSHFAASRIQKRWKHVISSPDYFICRKRLQNEFEALANVGFE